MTVVCLEQFLKVGKFRLENIKHESNRSWRYEDEVIIPTLATLLSITSENYPTIAKTVEDWLTKVINNDNDINASMAIEIVNYLPYSLRVYPHVDYDKDREKFWRILGDKIYTACESRINTLARKDETVCNIAFWRRKVDIKDIIDWHGLGIIFTESKPSIFRLLSSPAHQLLGVVLRASSYSDYLGRNPSKKRIEHDYEQIKKLGSILLSTPLPWVDRKQIQLFRVNPYLLDNRYYGGRTRKAKEMALDADMIFSGFAIIATGLEAVITNKGKLPGDLSKAIKDSDTILFDSVRWTFLARFQEIDEPIVLEELDKSGFRDEQRTLIQQWIRQEVNFIKPVVQSSLRKRSTKKNRTSVKGKAAKKR